MKKTAEPFLRTLIAALFMICLTAVSITASVNSDGSKKTNKNLPLSYFNNITASGSSTAKVTGVDKTTNVTFYNLYEHKTATYTVGTFKGSVDGQSASFYCIDLAHPLAEYSISQPHTYTDKGPTSTEITYILNNYYPFKSLPYNGSLGTAEKEAASVQLAIWYFSDGLDLTTVTDATLKARALAIKTDAVANAASYVPFETLLIIPSNQSIPTGTNAKFTVSTYDLNSNPLSGISVTLSATSGSLSSSSAVTGTSGTTSEITLSQGVSSTSTITATAAVTIPQGTKYVHKISPDSYQKLVLATPAGLTREVYSTVTWYTPSACDTKGFTTYTQGGWGSPSNSAPGKIRDLYFDQIFPGGLTIGGTYTIQFTSASAVKDFLPQGGTASALTQSYVNPTSKINVLAGQMAALTLNVAYDKAGKIGTNSTDLGNLYIQSGVFGGMSVSDFLVIANKALGGQTTAYSLSDINNTATAINENFDNGTTDNGYLTCQSQMKSSLGDRVWEDTNKNGIQDSGENGIASATVKLFDCNGNLLASTITDANGYYTFANLSAGSYTVMFVKPSGYVFTTQDTNSNGNDASDSDADITTGKTICISLAAGVNDMTWDAGLYKEVVDEKADLKIEKSVDNSSPKNNDIINYTIKVTNLGPNTAHNAVSTDLLPSGLDFQSASPSQGTYNNSTGIWTIGDLANGAIATLSISVKVNVANVNSSVYDLGVAKDFNLFVLQDLTQPSSDTEGKVAVGRDAVLGGYSVGDKLASNSGDVLVVGRDLTFTSGRVYNGNVVYGNSTNLPITAVSIDGTLRQEYPIDFAAAATYLENLSTQLGAYTANGTSAMQWGGITLTGVDPYLNVFKVNGSDLSSVSSVQIDVPNGSVVLVNISGTTVKWSGGLTVNGTSISNVLYNFYEASDLTIQGIDIRGSVLAPFASLNYPSGVINGQVIVKNMSGSGQFNYSLFQGHLPYERKITNVALISGCTTADPVTTNNSASVMVTVTNLTTSGSTGTSGSSTTTWTNVTSFTNGEIIYSMIYDASGNIYAGTWGGKIYKSTNGGTSWSLINAGMKVSYIWGLNISGNTLFAATDKGVYKYSSSVWTATSLSGKDVHALVSYNGTIYAGTWGYGVFTSADNGSTWTELNNGLGAYLTVQSLTVSADGTVFVGTAGYGVLKLSSGAWVKATTGYDVVWALTSASNYIYAGTYGNGLLKSADNGSTWTKVTSLNVAYVYALTSDGAGKVYASSYTDGIMTSADNGSTWTSLGMSGYGVSTVAVSSSAVFAGTKEGVIYKIADKTQVTGTESTNSVPTTYQLAQNYPNPFNPATTIQFTVPQTSRIMIRVYNSIGQEVAVLADQEYTTGVHKVNFDASRLASGMYIYQMIGKNINISKKMMLLK